MSTVTVLAVWPAAVIITFTVPEPARLCGSSTSTWSRPKYVPCGPANATWQGVLPTIAVTAEASPAVLDAVARELAGDPAVLSLAVEQGTIRVTATDATRAMAAVFGALSSREVPTRAASVARPSLDDVFLRETGRSLRDAGSRPANADASAAEVAA